MSPEQRARAEIDRVLTAAGWSVCSVAQANIHGNRGVAIREFPLADGYGFADYLLYVDAKAAGVMAATIKRRYARVPSNSGRRTNVQ